MAQEHPIAKDKHGRTLTFHTVLTICPIEYAAQARKIAAEFLDNGEQPEAMLNLNVKPVGGTKITHVACIRGAWSDEVEAQRAFIAEKHLSWALEMHTGADEDLLLTLGLEIA